MAENEDYNFSEAEPRIQKLWQDKQVYKFNQKSKNKIYSIDTPPPTVSGKMHIGHAFSYAQQDFMARFHRMLGENVFYPFGTDDNGLPTERLVEKMKNIKARDMPRDEFVKLCLELLEKKLIPEYISDWKRIGISCDWSVLYSTINEHCRRISQRSFIDIYNKKRAYRKDAPAMWCPECQTGISQVDCQDKELESEFNHIIFKCGKENLVIATTRPELLPACVSLFYHPGDKRYEKLKGKKARVPLFDFEVPIMEDERASMEKGTGIVMCCTFGDQTDMEWQKAHNLPIKEAISKDGTMSRISGKYSGMPIKMARSKIKQDLKEAGLIIKQEKIKHVVNVHERCGTEIEFVKSQQWFVKYLDLKPEMLKWGRALKWYPEHMVHRYENWVRGLQWDWLISRQRFFGVPFPVWYCKKCGEVILASDDELPVDPMKDKPRKKCKCGSSEFIPEKDILDTWFTSSMTPRLSVELMPKELEKKLFPMSLRPQASEIITFWLFNTVIKSNLHYKKNPFENVMVSGFVTLGGQKMAKSKGNVVEPQSVIEKYGADSLRYWAASSKLGEDIEYQEKEIVAGKKFVTKLWNAAKFISVNLSNKKPKKIYETDRLFLSKLNNIVEEVTGFMKNYEYARAKNEASNFFWHVFCDNYLEIVKKRVYSGTKEEKESAAYALYQSLLAILKMMAPITPYITEEVYQKFFKKFEKDESIHISSWPEKTKITEKKDDSEVLELLLSILGDVRMAKSKAQKSMKAEIILTLEKEKIDKLKNLIEDLTGVISAREIRAGSFKVEFV